MDKTQIKWIFCDLDGTLLNDRKEITQENIKAISLANSKGIGFSIATGRMPSMMLQEMKTIGTENDYAVCTDGAIIIKGDGVVLSKKAIEKKTVLTIFDTARKYKMGLLISNDDGILCYDKTIIEKSKDKWHIPLIEVNDDKLDGLNNESIYKISLVHPNHKYLETAKEYLETITDKGVSCAFSTDVTLEIVTKGCTKGQGIKDLCNTRGIDIEDIVVIGDNMNDMSMFTEAGYTACPSNACDEIKKVSDYVAVKDNNNSAIAEIINYFIKDEDRG